MTAEERLDLSRVKLHASVLPVSPADFEDMQAAGDFLARHRGCFEEWRTLVSREIRRADRPCPLEAEHDTFFHPSLFRGCAADRKAATDD